MSRLLWGAVALLGVILAVVLATAGPRGPVPDQALAHIITPTGTPGAPMVHLEIDADTTNGSGPCNPVDATAEVGGMYKVAVCLTSSSQRPGDFHFDLVYDDTLNTCVDKACDLEHGDKCLDDNPDANTGNITFSTPDLGTGWDCSWLDEPVCAKGGQAGRAHVACVCFHSFCATLPIGAETSAPIAVVTFNAEAVGTDNLKLENVQLMEEDYNCIMSCYDPPYGCGGGAGSCYGATLDVQEWTPTPSPTPTPTATPTPSGAVGGIAEPPDIESGAAASGPGVSVAGAAAVAMGAALLVAAGAWGLRRRRAG